MSGPKVWSGPSAFLARSTAWSSARLTPQQKPAVSATRIFICRRPRRRGLVSNWAIIPGGRLVAEAPGFDLPEQGEGVINWKRSALSRQFLRRAQDRFQ